MIQSRFSGLLLILIFSALAPNALAQMVIDMNANIQVKEGAYMIAKGDVNIKNGGQLYVRGAATVEGQLTNQSGHYALQVQSDYYGDGSGSLIEYSGVEATVQQFLDFGQYHYITAPVSDQDISILQNEWEPNSYDLFWYDENYSAPYGPSWVGGKDLMGVMEVAKGYALAYEYYELFADYQGVTNVGAIQTEVTYSYDANVSEDEGTFGWNLIGNPYPSKLDATLFVDAPVNSDISGTLYFWDESDSFANGQNDYATWNKTGATSGGGGNMPNGFVAVGQGFMVRYGSGTTPQNGTVTFNNAMRVHTEPVFFKKSSPAKIALILTNEDHAYNETLIGFMPGTSEGFDKKYDGVKLKGNTDIAFYSQLVKDDGLDYAIQALPAEAEEGVSVNLGMHVAQAGEYSISVKQMQSFNDTTEIMLEDTYKGMLTDLRAEPEYQFDVENTGEIEDRFILHFNKTSVEIIPEQSELANMTVFASNGKIIIETSEADLDYTTFVYDTDGRLLRSEKLTHSTRNEIDLNVSAGIYLVRVVSKEQVFTQKVFIN